MRTLRLDAARPGDMARAVALLRGGGLVAFPTETVYGLGADGLDGSAVRAVFTAKGRPADNPLILHVTGAAMLGAVGGPLPPQAQALAERFWPGPLTLVLPRGAAVPSEVCGGLDSVAVRAPAHPVALALIAGLGRPVAAPSANRSGRPSPTRAADVLEDLDGRIDAVLDGGDAPVGVESTVIDARQVPARLLRPGGLAAEAVEAVTGPLAPAEQEGPARSPGLRYRHYAPRARVVLAPAGAAAVQRAVREADSAGSLRVGCLLTDETADELAGTAASSRWCVLRLGHREDGAGQARRLFAALRDLDRLGVQLVVAESVPDLGLGRAVMDRLRRAAAGAPAAPGGTAP
jgi:L-threonylcarbamoyladenylate synthase